MTNPYRSLLLKPLCLIGLLSFFCGPAVGADLSTQSDDQLIARLQAAVAANPNTKTQGTEDIAASIAGGTARGDYVGTERELMQLKMHLSSDPDAVAVIELLLGRIQAFEAAAAAKRSEAANAILKDLTDRFNAHAKAQDYDQLLKRISDLATASASDVSYGTPRDMLGAQRIEDMRTFVAGWQEYLAATAAGNVSQAASQLNQLVQLTSRFTAVPRSALLSLQVAPSVPNPAAVEAVQKAQNEEFAVKFVAEIDAAKVPSDLDAVLSENAPTNRFGAQSFQGYSTKEFVRKWQDYLVAVQAGRDVEASKILLQLAANSDSTFYPRSKILARLSALSKASGLRPANGLLMDPASLTLDNLPTLLLQIDALAGDPTVLYEHSESNLRNAVAHLANAVDQLKTGDPKGATIAGQFMGAAGLSREVVGEYSEVLNRLYDQVTVASLPAYLDLPADLKPNPQEKLATYLDRVIKGAVAKQDWHLAYRAIQARSQIGPAAGNPDTETADLLGFRSMIVAMDKEAASQWSDATTGYLDALTATSPHLPTKEIGDRLVRIQREHPDDYAKAKLQPDYPSLVARLTELQRMGQAAPQLQRPRNLLPGVQGQPLPNGIPVGALPPGFPLTNPPMVAPH